ncbi:AmmeMemoRadiSam system protein B [Nannocystis radixulma]|uniref:AmmeMemoRadiSam system protein B n=1 Tax=Nannocystis radixulma TaxID=2995305 RepID=A0ABT5BIV8_9BACT|nr:AmmeMemoRadiSam system protein B [Nannocystis radixulma]MDC0674089.1 AmmeMemoRadiSam system protein B [Nannocystis radixulma]
MATDKPRLRKVERVALQRGDEALLVLRDPTGLSEQVAFPQEASVILDALDGQRTVPQLRQSLAMRGIIDIPLADLEALVRDLESAGYLDDDAFRARWEAIHREFLANPVRRPRWAGLLYPDDPTALGAALAAALPDPSARLADASDVLGVLLPHQPLPGTGAAPPDAAVHAAAGLSDEVLRGLPRARDIDLVVVVGTDYHPGLQPFVITDKRYATPRGELASDPALVRALDRRLPWIRREEIRHREALSLELAAAVLQHLYDGACPPVLPVLCGPGAIELDDGGPVESFLATMEHVLEDRRVLWWVTAELGHEGPAYGRAPLTRERAAALVARDRACLAALADARPEQLERCCKGVPGLDPPSGTAALVTAARLFPVGYGADLVAYASGRPVGPDDGWVGLGGVRFTRPVDSGDDDDFRPASPRAS